MWLSIWKWASGNRLLAGISVVCAILVLGSAVDFLGARNAASRYFDLAKGWAAAYQRDTAASKKEYEGKIKTLTDDRDAYKRKYEVAKGKLGAPWVPPADPKEIEERFLKMGYRGRVR